MRRNRHTMPSCLSWNQLIGPFVQKTVWVSLHALLDFRAGTWQVVNQHKGVKKQEYESSSWYVNWTVGEWLTHKNVTTILPINSSRLTRPARFCNSTRCSINRTHKGQFSFCTQKVWKMRGFNRQKAPLMKDATGLHSGKFQIQCCYSSLCQDISASAA